MYELATILKLECDGEGCDNTLRLTVKTWQDKEMESLDDAKKRLKEKAVSYWWVFIKYTLHNFKDETVYCPSCKLRYRDKQGGCVMDESEERIKALEKCVKLQEYLGGVRQIRIDQLLDILREKYETRMSQHTYENEWMVKLVRLPANIYNLGHAETFTSSTLEMCLDLACEWVLSN